MNITLVGYGKMNQVIEAEAAKLGHTIATRIDPILGTTVEDIPDGTDVVVDFSTPDAIMSNIRYYAQQAMKVLVGTTGWYQHLPEFEAFFRDTPGAFLWTSNCALGVHGYLHGIKELLRVVSEFPGFSVRFYENHHQEKGDAPSRTADIISLMIGPSVFHLDEQQPIIDAGGGEVFEFHHEVIIDADDGRMYFIHHSSNRNTHARGAIKAAEWIVSKTGYHTMEEWIESLLHNER